jgi:hypothetical protein
MGAKHFEESSRQGLCVNVVDGLVDIKIKALAKDIARVKNVVAACPCSSDG